MLTLVGLLAIAFVLLWTLLELARIDKAESEAKLRLRDFLAASERVEMRERENAALRDALAWGETFLARHDAFLRQQTPQLDHATRDAADGFRAALAALASHAAPEGSNR